MRIICQRLALYGSLFALAACVPETLTPTVAVMPTPGKPLQAFAAEQAACKQFAEQQIGPAREQAKNTVMTTALTTQEDNPVAAVQATAATVTATLQQQYDNAFSQCMYAKGNQVPGYAAAPSAPVSHIRRVRRPPTKATEPAAPAEAGFIEPPPVTQPAIR